jgi:hypothetical protein
MKKEYLKPAMRAVKLRHRQNLLVGSPGGYDGKTLGSYLGGDDTVTDGNEDTLF